MRRLLEKATAAYSLDNRNIRPLFLNLTRAPEIFMKRNSINTYQL
jgi:hypothetical protein